MRRHLLATAFMLLAAAPVTAEAQTLTGDFVKATQELETKVVGLANALSQAQYSWKPGEGVRSVREVLLHIAADNYFIPAAAGHEAPPEVKITDYASTLTFEKQNLSKEETIGALKKSFEFLREGMATVPDDAMKEKINMFGQEMTVHQVMLLTVNHLHEHLGQMIAYARSNGVKPPWSR